MKRHATTLVYLALALALPALTAGCDRTRPTPPIAEPAADAEATGSSATSTTKPTPRGAPLEPIAVAPAAAPAAETRVVATYTLSFDPPHHLIDVAARLDAAALPTDSEGRLTVMMPVWTPGSYLVREYARQVEGVRATDGSDKPLPVERVAKNRWQIGTDGAATVVLRYRVYGRERSVRTNWVQHDYAVLNGAPMFLLRADALDRPVDVVVRKPTGWTTVSCALPQIDKTGDGEGAVRLRARDADELIDSPIVLGNPEVHMFEREGISHRLVHIGDTSLWDVKRSARDVEAIVDIQHQFWRVVPYERYDFLNAITGGRGGLEHLHSTLLMTPADATVDREDYISWLDLVSHELFHAWNGKRLRPVELGPFDYERENYTRLLWVVEGFTSYYDTLLVRRAGLIDDKEYLKRLSKTLGKVMDSPGRHVQTLDEASFDAWIKFYRPDENTRNTAVSYYRRGTVVAWLLDAHIRKASRGRKTLDDAMRALYERFSGERGYTTSDLETTIEAATGVNVHDELELWARSSGDLPIDEAMAWWGLRAGGASKDKSTDTNREDAKRGALDADIDDRHGRLIVKRVERGGAGWDAGLMVDDELIALDGRRVTDLDAALKLHRPGAKATALIARADRLLELPVVFAEPADEQRWVLEVDPRAGRATRMRRRAWLTGR